MSHPNQIRTLASMLYTNAETAGDNTAIVYQQGRCSFLQHYERALKLANALATLGCQRHDRVAVLAKNCIEYLELYAACELAGYILVPINFRLSLPEMAYVCHNTSPFVCFYSADYAPAVAEIQSAAGDLKHFICLDAGHSEALSYADFSASGEVRTPDRKPEAEDAACIIHTSGTTGRPKGAVLSQSALYGIACNISNDAALRSSDFGLLMQPLFHVGALFLQLAHHVCGAGIRLENGFDTQRVWHLLSTENISTLQLVPTMLDMLLDAIKDGNYPQTQVKTIFYSTAPIREALLRRGLDVFGQVFLQQYGSTEAGQVTSLARALHIKDGSEEEQRWLTSAGKANPGVELRIVDAAGNSQGAGEAGEIIVRHDNIMQGYWNDSEATAAAINKGFLHMGDIGYVDEDGFLYIVDRKKDMIISGGENIYPREVEAALMLHPALAEAAVIGIPDERWGEAVLAVVVCHAGMSAGEEELIEHCRQHIASYKKPKSVRFVDALPRIATGKVDKVSLRKPYWSNRKRALI